MSSSRLSPIHVIAVRQALQYLETLATVEASLNFACLPTFVELYILPYNRL